MRNEATKLDEQASIHLDGVLSVALENAAGIGDNVPERDARPEGRETRRGAGPTAVWEA